MISFSAAISVFKKGGHWKRAAPVLDEMCVKGLPPSMGSFRFGDTFPVFFDGIAEAAKARLKD
eukprot:6448562-Karenia_brevis.AAC.1